MMMFADGADVGKLWERVALAVGTMDSAVSDFRKDAAQSPPDTPAEKSARTKRLKRQLRDARDAVEFAVLIRGGDTTESARRKMKGADGKPMGAVRAQRIRKIAVKMGWLKRNQQGQRKP